LLAAALATLLFFLAALTIYGVTSYSVAREREIAIRIVVGSNAADVW